MAIEASAAPRRRSSDEPDLFAALARRDPRIRLVTNPVNLGAAESATRGVAAARGDIIVRLDDRVDASKLGSVSLNRGGRSNYWASKAGLDTFAHSFAGQQKGSDWGVVLMHPGWMRTSLGGQRANLDIETSAWGMVAVPEPRPGQRGCV